MALNAPLLVDAIVRQTVVLIASLATGAGRRPSLSHVADQVFSDLVRELKQQGLGNKVIADMFGMALRTYHTRVAQLSESRSHQGGSLWAGVYEWVRAHGPALRADVLQRFRRDDPAMVRAVLRDLVESGLVYKAGSGDATRYRAAEAEEPPAPDNDALLGRLLLVSIHRHGPITQGELGELLALEDAERLATALSTLVEQGLVELRDGEPPRYDCQRCIIPFGDEAGWEAAVLDHYQALVAALVTKLRSGKRRAELDDHIGGSTFVFDLHQGHPLEQEVLGFLSRVRADGLSLRARLDQHEARTTPPPDAAPLRVVAYVGQTVTEQQEEEQHDEG